MRCWRAVLFSLGLLTGAGALTGAPNSFLIAALRVMPEAWNKEANFQKLDHWARQAAQQGAQLVITPEGFLEGYVVNSGKNPDTTEERYRSVVESLDGRLL